MSFPNVNPEDIELSELINILKQNGATLPETTQPKKFYEDLFTQLKTEKEANQPSLPRRRRRKLKSHSQSPNSSSNQNSSDEEMADEPSKEGEEKNDDEKEEEEEEEEVIKPPAKKKARKSINPFQSARGKLEETLIVNVAKDAVSGPEPPSVTSSTVIPDTPIIPDDNGEKPMVIEEERDVPVEKQQTFLVDSNKIPSNDNNDNNGNDTNTNNNNDNNDNVTNNNDNNDDNNGYSSGQVAMCSSNIFGMCVVDDPLNSPISHSPHNEINDDDIASPIHKNPNCQKRSVTQFENKENEDNEDNLHAYSSGDDNDDISDDDEYNNNNNNNANTNSHHNHHSRESLTSMSREEIQEIFYCKLDRFSNIVFQKFSPIVFGLCFLTFLFIFVFIYNSIVKVASPYYFCNSDGTGTQGCVQCPEHGTCKGDTLTCEDSYYRYLMYCAPNLTQYTEANKIGEKASKILGKRAWTHNFCGTPNTPLMRESELIDALGSDVSYDVWQVAKDKFFSYHKVSNRYDGKHGTTFYYTKYERSDWMNKCVFWTFAGWLKSVVPDVLVALAVIGFVYALKQRNEARKNADVEIDRMFERACDIIKTEVTINGRQYVLVSELHDAITNEMEMTKVTEDKWKRTMIRLKKYDVVKKGYAKINGKQVPVLSWNV